VGRGGRGWSVIVLWHRVSVGYRSHKLFPRENIIQI
jgi:hypothetical protein